MSQENVEIARRSFVNFNRRDKAAWLADIDSEHEVFPPKEWPENAPIRGAEACWDFYVTNADAFDEGDFELRELIDAGGETVVTNQHREMRGKSSGARIVYDFWIVTKYRNGKQLRTDWFATRAEALEAAGLPEIEDRDEEIIARLRRAYQAFSRGDFDAAAEIAHPDIELVTTGGMTNLRGADKFRAWMEPVTLKNVVMDPYEVEVMGNSVLVHQSSRGRGVESGIDVEMDFWVVCTIDDEGLVTRVVAYNHDQEARARSAAGLSG